MSWKDFNVATWHFQYRIPEEENWQFWRPFVWKHYHDSSQGPRKIYEERVVRAVLQVKVP